MGQKGALHLWYYIKKFDVATSTFTLQVLVQGFDTPQCIAKVRIFAQSSS